MSFSSPRYNGKRDFLGSSSSAASGASTSSRSVPSLTTGAPTRVAFGLSTASPRVSNDFLTGSADHKKDMVLGQISEKEIAVRMRPSNAPSMTAGTASAQDVARLEYQLAAAVSGAAELRVANQQLATRVIMNEGNVKLLQEEIEQARLDAAAEHNRAEKLLAQLEITQNRLVDNHTPVRIAKDISAIAKTKEAAVKAKAVTTSLRTTLKGAVQAMKEWQRNELATLHELQITAPLWVHQKIQYPSSLSTANKPNESFADPERSFDASSASFMRTQTDLKAKLATAQAELTAERQNRKVLTAKMEELENALNNKIEHTLLDSTLEKLALVQQQYSESQAAAAVSHSALKKAEVQLRAARAEMASLQEEVQTLRNQRSVTGNDTTGSNEGSVGTKDTGKNTSSSTTNTVKEQQIASERALAELRADYEKRLQEQAEDAKIAAQRIATEITALRTAVETMKKERDNSALTLRQVVSVFDEDRKLLMAQITALQSIDGPTSNDNSTSSSGTVTPSENAKEASVTPSVRNAVVAIETSGLRSEIARLEGELKEIRANTAAKETLWQKESLDHALVWQQQLLQYQAKVGELEKQLANRTEDEDELRSRLQAAHEGSVNSKKRIETLTKQVQDLQDILRKLNSDDTDGEGKTNDPLAQVKEATKEERETLKEMLKNKDRMIEQLRNQLLPLQKKEFRDSDLSAQLKEAQAVIGVLKATVKEVADEKVATVAKLSAKDSDLMALASQIPSHVSTVTKELQIQLGHARDEAVAAKAELHTLQAVQKELTNKLTTLETENSKLRKVAGTLQRFADIALSADAQSLSTRHASSANHTASSSPTHPTPSPSTVFKQINATDGAHFHAHPLPEPLARVLHSHRRSGSVPPSAKVSFDGTTVHGTSTVSDDYPTPPRPSTADISPRTRHRPMSASAAKARRELSVGALPPSTIKKRMVARTSRSELIKSGLIHPSQRKIPEREFNIDNLPYPTLPDALLHYAEIGTVHPVIPGTEEALEHKAENIVLHAAPAPHLHPTVAGVPLAELRTATPPKPTLPKASPVRPTRLANALTPAHSRADAKTLRNGNTANKRGPGNGLPANSSTVTTPFRTTVMDTQSSTAPATNSQGSALMGTVRKPKRIVARWGFAMYLLRTVQEENKMISLRHGFDQLRINTLRSRMEERERALAQVNRYLEEANIPAPDLPERFEQLRNEVENLRHALLDQQRQMEHARSDASALRAQLNASAHAREELLSKLQTEREHLSQAREETRRLVDALGENETERAQYEQELHPLRKVAERVPGLEADKARLEQDIRNLKMEVVRSQEVVNQLRKERELILGIAELLTPPRQSELMSSSSGSSSSSTVTSETVQALHRADLPADLAFLREQAVSIAAQLRTKAESIKALESTVHAANEALSIAQKQYETSQSELAKLRPEYERVRTTAERVPELQHELQSLSQEITEARTARDTAEAVKEASESKALQAIERMNRLQLELDQSVARAASLASAKVTLEAELLRLQVASKQAELQRTTTGGSTSGGNSLLPPATPRSSLLPSTPLRSTNSNNTGTILPGSSRRSSSGGGFLANPGTPLSSSSSSSSSMDYATIAATTQPKRTAPPPPPSSSSATQ